jgi:4a-hydroxytetrahydrobiopterin dehydratase
MKYFAQEENMLQATFEFKNFKWALDFVNVVWNIAEISNHHPDIYIHDYKYVSICSTTHDEWSKVSPKDHAIAKLIESSYKK